MLVRLCRRCVPQKELPWCAFLVQRGYREEGMSVSNNHLSRSNTNFAVESGEYTPMDRIGDARIIIGFLPVQQTTSTKGKNRIAYDE